MRCRYLSGLLTGGLVLCLLTQLPDPLVFGQEVLLLIHVLAVRPLVQWLPAHEQDREGDVAGMMSQLLPVYYRCHPMGDGVLKEKCLQGKGQSIEAHPRSTRKESRHVFVFLLNWNLTIRGDRQQRDSC